MSHEMMQSEKQLEEAIGQITAILRGPLSNLERACHVADRKELRVELARLRQLKEACHDQG